MSIQSKQFGLQGGTVNGRLPSTNPNQTPSTPSTGSSSGQLGNAGSSSSSNKPSFKDALFGGKKSGKSSNDGDGRLDERPGAERGGMRNSSAYDPTKDLLQNSASGRELCSKMGGAPCDSSKSPMQNIEDAIRKQNGCKTFGECQKTGFMDAKVKEDAKTYTEMIRLKEELGAAGHGHELDGNPMVDQLEKHYSDAYKKEFAAVQQRCPELTPEQVKARAQDAGAKAVECALMDGKVCMPNGQKARAFYAQAYDQGRIA
jgi:hypothetical protein